MKQVISMALILIAVSFNANAVGQSGAGANGCQIPINHIKELPDAISNKIPKNEGVESLITLPMSGDPKALILVTAPIWNYQCHTVEEINKAIESKEFGTGRQLMFWAIKDNKWVMLDHIANQNVIWPLDTYGTVSVSLIRDGDTIFRLVQESEFQRVSFSDNLSFKYGLNGKFRITNWVSNSHYVGMYGGGPEDTYEGYEAKQKANPSISDFDGYEGEIDYDKKAGWITKYKFEEVPVRRKIAIVTEPASLENLKKLFFLPSFDCSKATTKVELAICDNANLSNSDSDLNDLFKKVKSSCDAEKRKGLIAEQRNWLRQRESVCINKDKPDDEIKFQACLDKVYSERKKELRKILKTQKLNGRFVEP